jgi:hypothetical protein
MRELSESRILIVDDVPMHGDCGPPPRRLDLTDGEPENVLHAKN